ncbi:hypothetical protein FRB99_003432 [Tulasnella sp. 403]|nr:hypothetical protein FRB99_003432 [Tulasnella sp. 403]
MFAKLRSRIAIPSTPFRQLPTRRSSPIKSLASIFSRSGSTLNVPRGSSESNFRATASGSEIRYFKADSTLATERPTIPGNKVLSLPVEALDTESSSSTNASTLRTSSSSLPPKPINLLSRLRRRRAETKNQRTAKKAVVDGKRRQELPTCEDCELAMQSLQTALDEAQGKMAKLEARTATLLSIVDAYETVYGSKSASSSRESVPVISPHHTTPVSRIKHARHRHRQFPRVDPTPQTSKIAPVPTSHSTDPVQAARKENVDLRSLGTPAQKGAKKRGTLNDCDDLLTALEQVADTIHDLPIPIPSTRPRHPFQGRALLHTASASLAPSAIPRAQTHGEREAKGSKSHQTNFHEEMWWQHASGKVKLAPKQKGSSKENVAPTKAPASSSKTGMTKRTAAKAAAAAAAAPKKGLTKNATKPATATRAKPTAATVRKTKSETAKPKATASTKSKPAAAAKDKPAKPKATVGKKVTEGKKKSPTGTTAKAVKVKAAAKKAAVKAKSASPVKPAPKPPATAHKPTSKTSPARAPSPGKVPASKAKAPTSKKPASKILEGSSTALSVEFIGAHLIVMFTGSTVLRTMITPKFSCSQDELSVTVELYVPSVRASEVEIDVDGSLFSVHIKPYFLRLSFPGNVVEDDDSFARYDPSSGYLTVKLTKETKGEDFKDLDLLAKLLAPQGTTRQADNALADYVNDDEIQELIKWKSPYTTTESSPGSVQSVEFTEEENATMLRLPRKEYLTDAAQVGVLHHMLISILFGYAYDLRTTLDDPTPESAWTIASLTPAFSALDVSPFTTLSSTLISSYRRALAFPLYRNWSLCQTCQADVAGILKLGRRGVTRALLRTKRILDRHEAYYIYSKIWVDDFIVWVQSCATDAALHKLSGELRSFKLPKASVGWSLEELEAAAKDVQPDSDDETDEDDSQRPTPL